MFNIINKKLSEKKNNLEAELQKINNSLENLENAEIIYGVRIINAWKCGGRNEDAQFEGSDFKEVFKNVTEKFRRINGTDAVEETTICWAYVNGVYVYIFTGKYEDFFDETWAREMI